MDQTPTHQVIAAERSLLSAMKASDVTRLDELLHDDLLFNGPNGETATKAADLANYRSGKINLRTVESSDLVSSPIGDDVVVAVTVLIQGNYMGQAIDGKFRYLRVWKRFGAVWKVIGGSVVAKTLAIVTSSRSSMPLMGSLTPGEDERPSASCSPIRSTGGTT